MAPIARDMVFTTLTMKTYCGVELGESNGGIHAALDESGTAVATATARTASLLSMLPPAAASGAYLRSLPHGGRATPTAPSRPVTASHRPAMRDRPSRSSLETPPPALVLTSLLALTRAGQIP